VSEVPVIEFDRLSFSYGGPVSILEDVTFAVAERDFACIIGPNGGGKTTLLKLILGLLRPGVGHVRVLGGPPHVARRRIGYMPQHTQLDPQFPVDVLDVVLMGRLGKGRCFGPFGRRDKEVALQALREVGIHDLRNRPFSALSGGQRQRVLIARALACEPDVLLLDEPTANLDIGVQDDFHQLLHEMNKRLTLLMVSHDVGFVSKFVKKVICVNRRVIVHSTESLTGEAIREIYGRDMDMVLHGDHHDGHVHGGSSAA
jgi:zinc transport system ATP-binding protein